MLSVIYLYYLVIAAAEEISSYDFSTLHCLLEENNQPCTNKEDLFIEQNVTLFSPQLIQDYSVLDYMLIESIQTQNFSNLEEKSFHDVPDGIILSIPVCHLSDLKGKVLAFLILQWQNSEVIFKHVVKAFLNSNYVDTFSYMLQSFDFTDDNLRWIAEVASAINTEAARDLLTRAPLLFYCPPESIILNSKPERYFFLSLLDNSKDQNSMSLNKPVLRFWAYTMINNKFPESLENWNKFYIGRWGFFLTGATADELKQLMADNIDNFQNLFRLKFSSLQVRTLFDKFFLNKTLNENDFRSLSQAVTQLLPMHISSFPIDVGHLFGNFVPSSNAYSSSRQIVEMISANEYQNQTSDLKYPVSSFTGVLPLTIFQKFLNRSMNMSDFLTIQSSQLTKSKMYYMSIKHDILNFKSNEDIFSCTEYIKVLPAKDIIFNNSASHVLFHILSNIDATNVPLAFAIFDKLWPELSSASIFQMILRNSQPYVLLDYIPSRHFIDNNENLLQIITIDDHKKLPRNLVLSISKKIKDISSGFIYYNTNRSSSFLRSSVTCDDVSQIDPYYFIMFLSDYNNYMKLSGKMISKNIQKCCINKLLEVLQLKFLLVQNSPYRSKLSLLNDAEIDAIGGYILSGLPVTSIINSRHRRSIIKAIGKLSAGELLSAVPLIHLQKLVSILAQTISPSEKIKFSLFDFGNLTLFLEPKYIKQINEEYFRLFLEGNYLDQRVCAIQSVRSSWYNLIKAIFGDPDNWTYQTLVTLGDFLIVVPTSDLLKIKDKQWIYAVDSLITKYYEPELDSHLKFYEVCLAYLNHDEKMFYIDDLKKLIAILVRAAQLQINTIVSAKTLIQRNIEAKTENVFNFIESNEEMKFSFFPTKVVIDKELTHDNLTVSFPSISDKFGVYTSSDVKSSTADEIDISEISITRTTDRPNKNSQITSETESSTEGSFTTVNLFISSKYDPNTNIYNSSENDTITNVFNTNSHDEYKFNSSSTSEISKFSTERPWFYWVKLFSDLTKKNNDGNQSHSVSSEASITSDFTRKNDLDPEMSTSVSDSTNILDSGTVKSTNLFVYNFITLPPEPIQYSNGNIQEYVQSESQFGSHEHSLPEVVLSTQYTSTNGLNSPMLTSTNDAFNAQKHTSAESEFNALKYTSTEYKSNSPKHTSTENQSNSLMLTFTENVFETSQDTSTENLFKTQQDTSTLNLFQTQQDTSTENKFKTQQDTSTENLFKTQEDTSTLNLFQTQPDTSTENKFKTQQDTSTENVFKTQQDTSTQNKFKTQQDTSTQNPPNSWIHTSAQNAFNSEEHTSTEKYVSETPSILLDSTNGLNSFSFVMDEAHFSSPYTPRPEISDDNNIPDIIEAKPFLGQSVGKREKIDQNIENLINDKNNKTINKFLIGFLNSSNFKILDVNIIDTNNVNGIDDTLKTIGKNQNLKIKLNLKNKYEKLVTKRSTNEKWSCEALKMVGKATELILNESVISSLDDEDLINCIDLFAEMSLSKHTQNIIWKRIKPDNFITAGKLVAACDISDVQSKNFSYENRWSLENIYLLGKYNTNSNVRKHVVEEVWKTTKKPYPVELIVSLGSMICDLPDINSEIIKPSVLYKTSVVLGRALPCNFTCLSKLAVIATHEDSFNDPSNWNFGDVHDLGIIVSGLNISGWKTLILRNNDALTGLTEDAFECLPYKYTKMMKKIPIDILPQAISNRFMEYDTHNKLMNFDFYTPLSYPESISFATSIAPHKIIIMCFLLILMHFLI